LEHKVINCPHCGKIISTDFLTDNSERPKVTCPECGSQRNCKDGKEAVYGRHGWQYFVEDFLRCRLGNLDQLQTRKDIKHTLFTRQKKAQAMEIGRWHTEPMTLDHLKLQQLLRADPKRQRESRDSYTLVSERKSQPSKSWTYDELLNQTDVSGLVFPKMVMDYGA
jgi:DNA-directed RNA polymerase subunit RPC12/RpoP